ncbi:adventurous gliding motility lipoprotein CglB [Pyxidicoccus fallax]|uniref:Adventurous gliding motility lipoprotein CglB n=1 Tax=Pyxidicoccus fallax TaxID=394095 RepID=A0A848LQA9_9BACT|nr:adventurous gliding motility lipoprotein CglB [Pyxidicoccus fallax]NMO19664.1 adventurous gliding motility lipoprotein CglB [Pyxidicoccus fallax]NPC80460.1 adventurous gliding motility lipoprotein CglB [Pyxidicoccus fallax]
MRARPTLLSALAFGATVSALAGACQTYDFEEVDPLLLAQTTIEETVHARNRKPNIMLLVDTSASMMLPVNEADTDCRTTYQNQQITCGSVADVSAACNPQVCPTRWTELQAAVPKFLADTGPHVRFALTTYPETRGETGLNAFCRAASTESASVRQGMPTADDDASLLAHANKINDILQGIPNSGVGQPVGGTPTSQSLTFVGNLAALQDTDREQFVVLLTDGLPNCNENNIYSGEDAQCRCTTANCAPNQTGRRGCLDLDASAAAVKALADKKIKTIVIGFGAETAAGNGPLVLDAMARAGGFARTCEAGQTSCGPNDPCNPDTRLCQRGFYQAANQEELADALEKISKAVLPGEPCLIKLDPSQRPSDPSLVVVYIDGERTTAGNGTWNVVEEGVLFNGAMCDRILASTPDNPVDIEVRAIRQR